MSTGPTINKHRSKQDHPTPWDFIRAVEQRFGRLSTDLAASEQNKKAPAFISEAQNSLMRPWASLSGLLWLNPPFGHIEPWAAKCRYESEHGAKILLLTPASIGTVWFANHIHRHAMVYALTPRITFEGCPDPYPKDIILSIYWSGISGFDVWKWK